MSHLKVLVADGDERLRILFEHALSSEGHDVVTAAGRHEILERVQSGSFDLVLLDLAVPGYENASILESIKNADPSTIVVRLSASPSVDDVIASFRKGAYDYLVKPVRAAQLREFAARVVRVRDKGKRRSNLEKELASQKLRVDELKRRLTSDDPFENLVGTSSAISALKETVREVARTDSTVLVTGESGTGKGLVARMIHEASARRDGPFVEANCVVYSEGVLHSELFGHEKGAFTGAARTRRGRFEMAQTGTIFLDEIGDISPSTQLLLLRVLQDRTFERVGGDRTLETDARLIAATNRDLDEAMRRGSFRKDLFFRLNVIPVQLPALREHPEDIPALAQHFVQTCAQRTRREVQGFTPEALALMAHYKWPGNARELENAVERMVVLCRSDRIDVGELPSALHRKGTGCLPGSKGTLAEIERVRIQEALREASGNKKEAARRLGIHRSTLYTKIRKYGIRPDAENAA